jgi:hypothetical protein
VDDLLSGKAENVGHSFIFQAAGDEVGDIHSVRFRKFKVKKFKVQS